MLSTPHLLAGAAIARAIPNPVISLPAAFLSHFVLDAVPHWDGSPEAPFSKKVIGAASADYIFGASLIFLLTQGSTNQGIILAGAFVATSPDFILALSRHFQPRLASLKPLKSFNTFHSRIQVDTRFASGILASFAASLSALFFLVR